MKRFVPRPYQWKIIEAIEKNNIKKVLGILPRRCLHGDTHILLANGSFKLLKDIQVGDSILSWDGEKFVADNVKNKWATEQKKTITLRAMGCPALQCSPDHVVAYSNCAYPTVYWRKASELSKYSLVQNYAGLAEGNIHDPDLAELYGYLLTDGYVSGYQQPKFTNNNETILKRVEELAKKLFNTTVIWRPKGNGFDLGLSNGTKGGGCTHNPIKELFRKDSLDIPKSRRKLPNIVWDFDNDSLLRFFAAAISCDGSLFCHNQGFSVKESTRNIKHIPPGNEITISCGMSYDYGWDIYWLLRKIGIIPHVPYLEHGSNWKIKIGRGYAINMLLKNNRIYGKEDKQALMLERTKSNDVKARVTKGCYRNKVKKYYGEPDFLYDLETVKNHNFVANGYLVHNSGKDICAWNLAIRQCMRKTCTVFYILPTYAMARKIIWDAIDNDGFRLLDYAPDEICEQKNASDMKIRFKNGSILKLVGSDHYDSLVGSNFQAAIFSEYALQDPNAYFYLRPIAVANGAWMLFITTPRSYNHLYELYNIALNNPEWFVIKMNVEETGHIPLHLIQKEQAEGLISEDLIQQEYYCSFSCGVEGSFYGKYIDKMRLKGQISSVGFESAYKVHTSWDLGIRDSTAIIFFQVCNNIVRIIDCYEATDKGLEHFAQVLKEKNYNYGIHIGPHDLRVREYCSGGVTRLEKAAQLGIEFTICDKVPIIDGIECVRSSFSKMWIDEKNCSQLIKALENYRKEFDPKKKVYLGNPRHDWSSNYADSMRYLCLSLDKVRDGMTPSDIERNYREAIYGQDNSIPEVFRNGQRFY